jgi:hypothetical protein
MPALEVAGKGVGTEKTRELADRKQMNGMPFCPPSMFFTIATVPLRVGRTALVLQRSQASPSTGLVIKTL